MTTRPSWRHTLAALLSLIVVVIVGGGAVRAHADTLSPAQAGPARCLNGDLAVAYRGAEGAAGHVYGRLVLTNVSDSTCTVQGFGGVSYVGRDGAQVGAAATRSAARAPLVTLAPGDRARARLVETSSGVYDRAECRPRPVRSLRVYVPDAFASQVLAHRTTGCADEDVALLRVGPYRAV